MKIKCLAHSSYVVIKVRCESRITQRLLIEKDNDMGALATLIEVMFLVLEWRIVGLHDGFH